MTKPRRIILLAVDILTLLGGLVALAVFANFTFTKSGTPPSILSHQEINSASITALRSEVTLGNNNIIFLTETLTEWASLLLFFGAVMFIGSILRFLLTPWRSNDGKNDPAP
jgi:hypothetical protein